MPTGYTAGVQDGTVTEFREYALACARAFGALIMMRDEPMDKRIPDAFKPDNTYGKWAEEKRGRLRTVEAMTLDEATAKAREEYEDAVKSWQERSERRITQRHRYEKMLREATAYVAPSAEHEGFRDFMISQLTESIEFDCRSDYDTYPVPQDGAEWRTKEIKELRRSIDSNEKQQQKEIERTAGRNRWIRQLRESLAK